MFLDWRESDWERERERSEDDFFLPNLLLFFEEIALVLALRAALSFSSPELLQLRVSIGLVRTGGVDLEEGLSLEGEGDETTTVSSLAAGGAAVGGGLGLAAYWLGDFDRLPASVAMTWSDALSLSCCPDQ